MKAKIIILLAFLLIIVESALGQNANKILRDIRNTQLSQFVESTDFLNRFHKLRKKSKYLNEFIPFGKNDTIFMIEQFNIESYDILLSTYWNKSKQISTYSEDSGKTFAFIKNYSFTKHMIKLVTEWNIEEIKKEGKENGVFSPIGLFATRIILNGKKYKIDCFYFDDFFNMERDQFDYLE